MKINDLFLSGKPLFSLEMFPPKNGGVEKAYEAAEKLAALEPDFISVTYGAGGSRIGDYSRKLASRVKNALRVEALAHITCINSSRKEILENLRELEENGIENVLALRGDVRPDCPPVGDFAHADELVEFIKSVGDMNVAGACYPEGHPESKNLDEDISNLRRKLDAGVTHLITQLFFDNGKFYNFTEKLRKAGIAVPVEAGIMPIVNSRQTEKIVALSGASLPKNFVRMIEKYGDDAEALRAAGTAYAAEQIRDLLRNGVDGIHIYTMNDAETTGEIYEAIKEDLRRGTKCSG